jgi:hypothetical protein
MRIESRTQANRNLWEHYLIKQVLVNSTKVIFTFQNQALAGSLLEIEYIGAISVPGFRKLGS